MNQEVFLPQRGDYKNLKVFKYLIIIYDITYKFINKHLKDGDRTRDQMEQAASNIALTMIHMADAMLQGLQNRQKKDFLENGGIREQMHKARSKYRKDQENKSSSS